LAQRILACVESIPVGRVLAYSDVAEFVGTRSARDGGTVAWHRVVRADGTCAPQLRDRQLEILRAEGVAIRGERVSLAEARWDGQ
jgi:alkylated DNA nucleotide flippase Atl1